MPVDTLPHIQHFNFPDNTFDFTYNSAILLKDSFAFNFSSSNPSTLDNTTSLFSSSNQIELAAPFDLDLFDTQSL